MDEIDAHEKNKTRVDKLIDTPRESRNLTAEQTHTASISAEFVSKAARDNIASMQLATKSTQALLKSSIFQTQMTLTEISAQLAPAAAALAAVASNLSDSLSSFQKAMSSWQPTLLESARAIAQVYDSVSFSSITASLEGVKLAMLPLQRQVHVYDVLRESQWPLYLVGCDDLTTELEKIELERDTSEIAIDVTELAFHYLDNEWLESVSRRWSQKSELGAGKKELLSKALEYHAMENYTASVSVLMCMLEGLIAAYFGVAVSLSNKDEEKLFDELANEFGLVPIANRKTQKLGNVKDIVLVALLRSEDGGRMAWQGAIGYLIEIVFTNKTDSELAAHNPLRNKICHGEQTAYGTKEHSLKAILATDIVIRLGATALAGSCLRTEERTKGCGQPGICD